MSTIKKIIYITLLYPYYQSPHVKCIILHFHGNPIVVDGRGSAIQSVLPGQQAVVSGVVVILELDHI